MILHQGGFPIRKSADITDICSSPQLIAACHVLRRLPMPRHSPYALVRLNSLSNFFSLFSLFLELLELSFRKLLISMFIFPLSRQNCNSITHLITERPSNLLKNLLNYLFVCFLIRFSMTISLSTLLWTSWLNHYPQPLWVSGGLKWTRTTDLALIRRAL